MENNEAYYLKNPTEHPGVKIWFDQLMADQTRKMAEKIKNGDFDLYLEPSGKQSSPLPTFAQPQELDGVGSVSHSEDKPASDLSSCHPNSVSSKSPEVE